MIKQRRTYCAILMTLWATTALGGDDKPFEDFNFNNLNFDDINFDEIIFDEINPQKPNPDIDTIDTLVKLKEGSFDKKWRYKKETINGKICTTTIDKNIYFTILKYLFPKDINNFAMTCKDGLFLKRHHHSLQINTDYLPFKTPKIAIEQLTEFYPNLKELIIINPTPKYLQEIGKNQKNKKEQESKLEHVCLTFLDQDTTALEKLNMLPKTLKSLTIEFPEHEGSKNIGSITTKHIKHMPEDLEQLSVINVYKGPSEPVMTAISSRFKKLKDFSVSSVQHFYKTLGQNSSNIIFETIETLKLPRYYFTDAGLGMIKKEFFPNLKEFVFSYTHMDFKPKEMQSDKKYFTIDGLIKLWDSNPSLKKLTIVNHGFKQYIKKDIQQVMPIEDLKKTQETAKLYNVTFNLSCFPNQIKLCESCLDYYTQKPNITNEKRKTSATNSKDNKRKKK